MHSEHDAVVTGTAPWGAAVRLTDGVPGFLDHLKGGASLAVGDTCHVVVVDDARDPVRVSASQADLDIGRRLHRRGPQEGPPVPDDEDVPVAERARGREDGPALAGRHAVLDALALLRSELPRAEGWENDDLAGFLEAFEALLGCVEQVYLSESRPVPNDPWVLVAAALEGARYYE
ncbi:DUF7660 family protein [Cellulomonas cellasea]|nr:hypothetical protein [Cellulomonas cellasea]